MYAGCVYWPFHGHTTIGTVLVSLILVGGVIDAVVKTVKEKASRCDLQRGEKDLVKPGATVKQVFE